MSRHAGTHQHRNPDSQAILPGELQIKQSVGVLLVLSGLPRRTRFLLSHIQDFGSLWDEEDTYDDAVMSAYHLSSA